MLYTSQDYTSHRLTATSSFINILVLFVDDFIGMTNNSAQEHPRHFIRAMILGYITCYHHQKYLATKAKTQYLRKIWTKGKVNGKQQKISWAG